MKPTTLGLNDLLYYYFEHCIESRLSWRESSPRGPKEGTKGQGLTHPRVSGLLDLMLSWPTHSWSITRHLVGNCQEQFLLD